MMSVEEERAMNIQQQQRLGPGLVIRNMPQHVEDQELEQEVVKLFNAMNVRFDYRHIEAVFRAGDHGWVIVKLFDPIMVSRVLSKGASLQDLDLYGGVRIYISQSLCREYLNIHHFLRMAKKEGRIHRHRKWVGTNQVQVKEDDDFVDITHRNDLKELGIVYERDLSTWEFLKDTRGAVRS